MEKQLLEKIDLAIELADEALNTIYTTEDSFFVYRWVSIDSFAKFESFSLSLILSIFSTSHPYYERFRDKVYRESVDCVQIGKGILTSIRTEVERGWLLTMKDLISAEIFTDFLEMAEYLLHEKYIHPAAVIIGSVLEEHLRRLSEMHGISLTIVKNNKEIPKKADLLNAELAKVGAYSKLYQKNVTAWLDLRNKAAHGHYTEYNFQQVEFMLLGVTDFVSRSRK